MRRRDDVTPPWLHYVIGGLLVLAAIIGLAVAVVLGVEGESWLLVLLVVLVALVVCLFGTVVCLMVPSDEPKR